MNAALEWRKAIIAIFFFLRQNTHAYIVITREMESKQHFKNKNMIETLMNLNFSHHFFYFSDLL